MSEDTIIDLTEFEGIGDWEVEKRPDGGYAIKTGRDNFSLEEAETIAKLPDLIAELKRCYEMIDKMQGNVPYVEHCEECGATDGGEAEGCDYCGITHYRSKPRGFLHRDSPKW